MGRYSKCVSEKILTNKNYIYLIASGELLTDLDLLFSAPGIATFALAKTHKLG